MATSLHQMDRSGGAIRGGEMAGEPLGVDRGRGDDEMQVIASIEKPSEIAEEKSTLRLRSCASSMMRVS
jgi:hypothetical protein